MCFDYQLMVIFGFIFFNLFVLVLLILFGVFYT